MKNGGLQKLLLGIVCILLFIAFSGLLIWSKKDDATEARRLQQLSDEQNVSETAPGDEKTPGNKRENSAPGNSTRSGPAGTSEITEPGTADQETFGEEDDRGPVAEAEGIVCWGDDLINGEASATYGYCAVLRRLLAESGSPLTVIDKTIQGGGTLSMMTMAGVPEDEVSAFIAAHEAAAGDAELYITEKGIRDLTPEQLERNDLKCIPVIFMGYYGGWNHDPAELAQQQRKILETFPDTKRFIIAGTRPVDGSVTSDALDSMMKETWGEHYISLAEITESAASTYEAQEALAEAVLERMETLGYMGDQTGI